MSSPAQFQIAMLVKADVANAKSGFVDITGAVQTFSGAATKAGAAASQQAADLQKLAAAAVQATGAQDQLVAAEKRTSDARARTLIAPLANPAASVAPLQAAFKATQTSAQSLQQAVGGLNVSIGSQAQEMIEGATATRAYKDALDDMRASFNPLFAASRQYEQQLERIAQAEKLGAISAREAAAARVTAADRLNPSIQPMGPSMGGYTANIGAQGFDIGVTALMGMNPAMIGFQQGSQLAGIAQQMGGGTKAAREMAKGILSIFNATSLVTIGLTTLAAVGIQALLSLTSNAKTFDDHLQDMNDVLGRMRANLGIVGSSRLSDTFGSLTREAKGLAQGLIELDRVSELKSLQGVIDTFLKVETTPTVGQSFWQFFNPGGAMGGVPLTSTQLSAARYSDMGAANSFDDFTARTSEISRLAKDGDVEGVVEQLVSLQQAMAGGDSITDMSDELRKLLSELAAVGIETAEVEALWNGTAKSEAIKRQTDQMVLAYRQETEIAAAQSQFGADSIEVERIRGRHARELLAIRLEEMGVQVGSLDWQRAHVALSERQAGLERAALEARKEWVFDQQDRLDGINSEISLIGASNAERLHTNALAEAEIEIRKRKLVGMEAEEQRARAIARAEAEANLERRRALQDISTTGMMDGFDARIAGERNPQIRAAIEAEKEYARQIASGADATVAAAAAAQVRARALSDLRQEQADFLRDQGESIQQLQLELALIGQTEAVRTRVLALAQAERDILRLGLTEQDAELVRRNAAAQAELGREIEAQADAWKRVQSAGESAIDSVLDRLRAGDVKGAFADLLGEIEQGFFDLAIRNPLKNALFGSNLGTWEDVGGWGGIVGRLTGQNRVDESSLISQAMAPIQAMTVNAANVTIGGTGAMAFLSTSGGGAGIAPMGAFSGLGGSGDVQSQVWAFFAAKGLKPHQIAAIMGNIGAESGFNPLAVGDGGTSFGLFQHHAGRGQSLLDFVGGQAGLANVQAQLEFMWQEMLTGENGVLKRLNASTNVYDATSAFVGFERPQGWSAGNPQGAMHWDKRLAGAEAAMAAFEGQVYATGQGVGLLGTGAAAMGQNLQGFGSQLGGLLQGIGAQHGPLGSFAGGLLSHWLSGIGFMSGGDTGPGADTDVAGVVHANEYVFDARATRRIGVANLEAIRRGTMRGYQQGGHVVGGLPLMAPISPGGEASPAAAQSDRRVVFEINVSGTSNAELQQGVDQAIARAFDVYGREVLPSEVKRISADKWGS